MKKMKLIFIASFLMSFAYGTMLVLPLHIEAIGLDILVTGKIVSFGTLGVITSILALPVATKKIGSNIIAFVGALSYAVGILLIITNKTYLLYFAGVILGAGWGIVYTIGPVIISEFSNDNNRAAQLNLIAGFNMLGLGLAPIVTQYIMSNYSVKFEGVFVITSLLVLLSAVIFATCKTHKGKLQQHQGTYQISYCSFFTNIPMYMVLLGACIFSSMINFQTVMAKERGLEFSYFYSSYTAAVIISRFVLAKPLSYIRRDKAIVLLLAMMSVSMIMFIYVNNNIFYSISSLLLGVSYGLVYPLIQVESIAKANSELERRYTLILFSLCYFIGVYGFPIIYTYIVYAYGYNISFVSLLIIALCELILALIIYGNHKKILLM